MIQKMKQWIPNLIPEEIAWVQELIQVITDSKSNGAKSISVLNFTCQKILIWTNIQFLKTNKERQFKTLSITLQ
jgi:hypothetical protein